MSDETMAPFTGAASVDGNVTPTLREPIPQVTPDKWPDMSATQLWDQRGILMQRVHYAQLNNSPGLVQQLMRGVHSLDMIIQQKSAAAGDATRLI